MDTRGVNDDLNRIPPNRRRRMALTLTPMGLVLLLAGVLTVLLGGLAWKLVGLLIAVLALGVLGIASGLRRSATLTEAAVAEARVDEAIAAASGPCGSSCGSAGAGGCGAACLTRHP